MFFLAQFVCVNLDLFVAVAGGFGAGGRGHGDVLF